MLDFHDRVPDLSIETPDGGTLRMSDMAGQTIVLFFYPKDDTSGCTSEAQDFSRLKAAFEMEGAHVLGISKGTSAGKIKFAEKAHITVPLGTDVDGTVCDAFGTWIEKSMYGRKYMGIDRATFLIDGEGKIAQVWRKVKVPGHADEVLAAARALKTA